MTATPVAIRAGATDAHRFHAASHAVGWRITAGNDPMSFRRHAARRLMTLPLLLLAAACTPPGPTPEQRAAAAASAAEAQANKSLDLYRILLQEKSFELAAPIGQEIVEKYPASTAAKEVAATLADAKAKGTEISTRRRLEHLWIYQSGEESGGQQTSASLYSADQAADDRVRLVLRRHSDWGQSVYLYGAGKGFECRATCALAARFDGKVETIKAYRPETGEPALFIRDDKAFLARLAKARKIGIEVKETGRKPRTLMFEVGGFDPVRWPQPPKKG
jgi:hypothetical protein